MLSALRSGVCLGHASSLGPLTAAIALQLRWQATQAGTSPKFMKATLGGLGENATTLINKDAYKFVVDEPPKLGGKGLAPNPLTYFLGSLAGCTQYTIHMIAKEMKAPPIHRIAWSAEGEYDLRGVRGEEGVSARFQRVLLNGTVDGEASQEDLDGIAQQVDRRCIVAATIQASGADVHLKLEKGRVDHDCTPTCELHSLAGEEAGGATGVVDGEVSREADSPKFAGTGGQGAPRTRAYHTLPHSLMGTRSLHTTPAWLWGDGEENARENMHAEQAPQLTKKYGEEYQPKETAGGGYAGVREAPKSQVPLEGSQGGVAEKSSELAGEVHPQDIDRAEGGKAVEKGDAPTPGFAERMVQEEDKGEQETQLGVQPSGQE